MHTPFVVTNSFFYELPSNQALLDFEFAKDYHKELLGLIGQGVKAEVTGFDIDSGIDFLKEDILFVEACNFQTLVELKQWLETEAPALFQEYLNKKAFEATSQTEEV
jgi:hypothetical protein